MPNVVIAIAAGVRICKVRRSIIKAVRPGVGTEHLQATAQSPMEFNLYGIVVRGKTVAIELHRGKIWIEGLNVDLTELQESPSKMPNVGNGQRLLAS